MKVGIHPKFLDTSIEILPRWNEDDFLEKIQDILPYCIDIISIISADWHRH